MREALVQVIGQKIDPLKMAKFQTKEESDAEMQPEYKEEKAE